MIEAPKKLNTYMQVWKELDDGCRQVGRRRERDRRTEAAREQI